MISQWKKIYHHLNESSFINKDLHGSCYDALCLVIKHSTEMFILNIISIHSSDRTYLTKGGGGLEEWPKFNIETIKAIKKKKVLGEMRWNYIFLTSSHREKVMNLEGNKTISN